MQFIEEKTDGRLSLDAGTLYGGLLVSQGTWLNKMAAKGYRLIRTSKILYEFETGNVPPYNNYPMEIETGQIFIIDYTKADGSVVREYHRSDGYTWQGSFATKEFIIE